MTGLGTVRIQGRVFTITDLQLKGSNLHITCTHRSMAPIVDGWDHVTGEVFGPDGMKVLDYPPLISVQPLRANATLTVLLQVNIYDTRPATMHEHYRSAAARRRNRI